MPGASRCCQDSGGRPGLAKITLTPRHRAAALTWVALWLAPSLLATACQGGAGRVGLIARGVAHGPAAVVTITAGTLSSASVWPATGAAGARGSGQTRHATQAGTPQGLPVDRRPDLGARVSVTGGTLSRVVVSTGSGKVAPGSLGPDASTWRTDWALAPARTYRVTATAVTPKGGKIVASRAFRTMTPRQTFAASTYLAPRQGVGVGMPIMVAFSQPITDRAEVERALEIRASQPVIGAWYWMSDRAVWFRPRKFWPAHTRVTLVAHLAGVRGAPGRYGTTNLVEHLRIGDSLIAIASASRHIMKVWWKGHFEGNWPISTGLPGDDTPNGQYLSFAMGNPVDMNSASFGVMPGDPGYYNVLVYDSVQFTYSGDYVHSAPWSVAQQGIVNVSHGCVNVAPGNAAWYYAHSLLGDPITIVGSPLRGTWGDGWTIWFLSWRKLVAGSATGQAVLASARGSRFVSPKNIRPHHMRTRALAGP
jgi:lipoprotein-anchoring transpeptidase ErfK/SrfK